MQLHQAKFFYGVLIVASVAGMALNRTPIDPVKALYWSAVTDGLVVVCPLMIVMMAGDRGDGRGGGSYVRHLGHPGRASRRPHGIRCILEFAWTGFHHRADILIRVLS